MANPIYVFCRSNRPITYGTLEEVMAHLGMGFLDHPVTFDPPPDKADPDDSEWRHIEVAYHGGKRPIDIHHLLTPDELRPTVNEIIDRTTLR